ncbi:MAG TPA: SusC/RagA family TonB-linked outer membrane protein [Dinghuibacter sp.]|uniref:SusC/RagA family TonB-linked outer membrane protein n=1 Tax=Dinghuibacter sp. TaxID=2024697 RepID=UPI002CED4DA8|nr:SusC/RagA family TonB-linked outer membrane protein [Dinghuibacter sp.]HTJ13169.1 SusC/RagA family TonB-linked outer membrane protein [Dinghuibacter sp.]
MNPRQALLTVLPWTAGLFLVLGAPAAAQTTRTIHGQLQGSNQRPATGLTIRSTRTGATARSKNSGEFSLKTGATGDSLVVDIPDSLAPGSGVRTAGIGIGIEDSVVMIEILKTGALKIMGKPGTDSTGKPVAPAASGAAAPPGSAGAAPKSDSGVVVRAPSKKSDSSTIGDSVKTVTAPAQAAVDTTHGNAPVAAAVSPGAADTVPKTPAFKGPAINGIVVGPDNRPLDSVRVTTAGGVNVRAGSDGAFRAPFVKGSYLLVSKSGYETVKVLMTEAGAVLTVKLAKSATREIEEVKVTALGISQKSRAVGYSIQEVGGQEVAVAKETNFVDALQGKLAGVNINANNGSMGGSTKVTIRGDKSITQTNDALYVVDGVFMSNENVNAIGQQIGGGGYDYGSPIQDVNPDDIQEVSVLKGAAATALYGSRGQNGVILITTKKGAPGRRFGVDYSLNVEAQKVYVLPKFQNEYGAGIGGFDTLWYNQNPTLFKSASSPAYTDATRGGYDLLPQYSVDESWGPKLNGQLIRAYYSFDPDKNNPFFDELTPWSPQPNNVKDFFKTGITVNNNIAFGGSDDKATYRMSYGNMTQNFILPNSHQTRNNLSFSGSYKVNPWLTGVASANYVNNAATGRPGTGFTGSNPMLNFVEYGQRQLEDSKLRYYKFPDGTQLSWNRTSPTNPAPAFDDNIYWERYMEAETDTRNRLFGQAGFDIKPVSWLTIQARVYMDQFRILQEERTAKDYFAGSYTRTDRQFQELDYQLLATARKSFARNWDLNVTVGGNVEQQDDQYQQGAIPISEGLAIPGIYTLSNAAAGIVQYASDDIRKQINSAFATGTLGYKDMLYLDVTGRNDWTSALAPGHNAYFYPSAALSWVFSDVLKARWLSFGKLRSSFAQVGNDITPYSIYDTYTAPQTFGSDPTSTTNPVKNNPDLKPERSTEFEEGLEARFLHDRIGFDFTWYNRVTNDLIVPMQISPTTGYTNVYVNAASVRNRGIELEVNARPLEFKHFSWDIAVNFARNKNMVTAINIPNAPGQTQIVLATERRLNSVSVAAVKGQPLFALIGTDYTYLNGQKVVDTNGLYVPSAPGQVIGHTTPDFTGGVTNTFRVGPVILSVLVDFQKGGNFFSYTNLYGEYSGTLAVTAANGVRENGIVAPGVLANGQPNTKVMPAMTYFDSDRGKRVNKANMYDDSYVYLREVRLGYNLPSRWAGKLKADNLRLSLYGRNLWLINSNAPNVDPSNIVNSDSNVQGLEGGALPSVRSFGVNLTAGF